MIRNYIKLAWRVLGRKKFFTFISLFGISFTLGILMVTLSFLQSELGSNKPLTKKGDFVLAEGLRLQRIYYDTIFVIDTTELDGVMIFDSTQNIERRGSMQWNSGMNNGIAEEYLNDLPSAEMMTIFTTGSDYDVYVNGVKLSLGVLHGDHNYFKIIDHEILEGRSFDKSELEQAAKVILISTKTAESYFGRSSGVIGEEMFIDGKNFQVIGVYPFVGKFVPFICPDAVIPYTNLKLEDQPTYYHGYFSTLFLKKPNASTEQMKKEIENAASTVPLDHPTKPDGYNEVVFLPASYDEMFAQAVYYDEDETKSKRIMTWVLVSLLIFFTVLPTLNLINLNVSRIMDRSAEIGVRKAFGAHQGNIISQFIIENIVLTLIGGFLGLGLALLLIKILNDGGLLGDAILSLNPKFFIYSILITLLFGVLSGLLPAWRMSKLQIVNALKENKL